MHVETSPVPEVDSEETLTLQHVVRTFAEAYLGTVGHASKADFKILRALAGCRTSAMGGHVRRCDSCSFSRVVYNACRSRHCPVCAQAQSAKWLPAREAELLPVEYRHTVFKLPRALVGLALGNKQVVYNALFGAAWASLNTEGQDPQYLGAEMGAMAVLHTWTQSLTYHPHLHVLSTAGGLSKGQTAWVEAKSGFGDPQRLGTRFIQELVRRLRSSYARGELRMQAEPGPEDVGAFEALLVEAERSSGWVYSKPPFESPARTLAYLAPGRGVPLSNARIVAVGAQEVTISCRGSSGGGQEGRVTLPGVELLRRLLRHTLPKGAPRIRWYGLLGCRNRRAKLARCRELLGVAAVPSSSAVTASDEGEPCPSCNTGRLRRAEDVVRTVLWFRVPSVAQAIAANGVSHLGAHEVTRMAKLIPLSQEG